MQPWQLKKPGSPRYQEQKRKKERHGVFLIFVKEMEKRIDYDRQRAEHKPQDFSSLRKIQKQSEIGQKKQQKG
jgi:hypothetical protein